MTAQPQEWPATPLESTPGFEQHEWPTRPPVFVSGDPEGHRLRVRYFFRQSDRALFGEVWFGPGAEGPPSCAHGGSQAAVLDEAMGVAAWGAGHAVLAASITINFRSMLPLHTHARIQSWVERVDGKKIITKAHLIDDDGKVFSDAQGLFIKITPEYITQFASK